MKTNLNKGVKARKIRELKLLLDVRLIKTIFLVD